MTSKTNETAAKPIRQDEERRVAQPHLFFVNGRLHADGSEMREHVVKLSRREVSL